MGSKVIFGLLTYFGRTDRRVTFGEFVQASGDGEQGIQTKGYPKSSLSHLCSSLFNINFTIKLNS